MDGYLGMIMLWPLSWAPQNWMFCQGQLLSVSGNQALFSLLGVTYGGDGRTTFALPDLRGRVPVGAGQGAGLSNYLLAQKAGNEQTTLTVNQMPVHTHTAAFVSPAVKVTPTVTNNLTATATPNLTSQIPANSNSVANSDTPGPSYSLGKVSDTGSGSASIYSSQPPNTTIKGGAVTGAVNVTVGGTVNVTIPDVQVTGTVTVNNAGASQPYFNLQPYLALNYIICTTGLYPSRPD